LGAGAATPSGEITRGIASQGFIFYDADVQRVVHKCLTFQEADDWDIRQQRLLTPSQRFRIARALRRKVFGASCPDVRAWHRKH
jgi:hypothetical protein